MRKILLAFSLLMLVACTSEESKVQETALEGAKEIFQKEVREKSDFEVQKIEIQGDTAQAVVQALTVPLKARAALIEIMGKLDEKKERNFNVSDALRIITQQMDLTETKSLQVYKLRLEKSGRWNVLKDAK
jgi:fructose/tagatose bisphosphate aldolase